MDFTELRGNLEKRGYRVSCFETKQEAADYLDREIDGTSVGFGGSATLNELGLYERLGTHNTVFWHDRAGTEGKDPAEVRGQAAGAKVYLASANGVAQTGEIINIDGRGNRVGSMIYGHEKVFFVIGENKVAPDYDSALYRARNIASPRNAKRLGVKTPCAVKADHCYDCRSPERICRALVVFWENLIGADTEVVLVNEPLGF